MRVLFHCYEFPPIPGGVGAYIAQMGRALRSAGHDVVVVTSRYPGEPAYTDTACGVVYRAYDREEMHSVRVQELVLQTARRHQVDLIEGADHYGEVAGLFDRKDRPPILVKIHGSNPIHILQESHVLFAWQRVTLALARLRALRQTRAEHRAIEGGDAALTPSVRMLEELRRQGFRLPAFTACVPNPMISEFQAPVPQEAKDPTLLLVGRIDVGKGIQYLPRLLKRIRQTHDRVVLEIAGDDSYARGIGSLKAWLCQQLGQDAGSIRFLGRLSRTELNEAYGRAWVVIMPSRWDNFPTVLLEAMAHHKPVVASPHGGMTEMLAGTPCRCLEPGDSGFADEVVRLLGNAEARADAGNALWQRVREAYSPEVVVRQYTRFIEQTGLLRVQRPSRELPS